MAQQQLSTTRTSVWLSWFICMLGAVFYCYEYLLRIQPSVMVTQLRQQFDLPAKDFATLAALYYLAYTPMQLIVGVLTDMFGPRRTLTFAVFVCALGSFMFGYTDSVYVAGAGRFLIGFGSAFAFVGVLKLAAIWLPSKRFAMFAGLATALGMVGAMVGDVELSVLVNRIGWQETVFYSTIAGVILTPIIWFVVRDSQTGEKIATEEYVTFKQATRGALEIARNKEMWFTGIIGCALFMSLSVFAELWGITFLQRVYSLTSEQAAYATAMVFFGWLVGAPFMGWISDRLRSRTMPLLIGCLVSAVLISLVIYYPYFDFFSLEVLLFFFGVFSSTEVICFAIGRELSPFHMSGAAVAFVNMLVMFGGMALQPLVGYLLDLSWIGIYEEGIRAYTAHDFQLALTMMPGMLVIGALLTFLIRDTHGIAEHEG